MGIRVLKKKEKKRKREKKKYVVCTNGRKKNTLKKMKHTRSPSINAYLQYKCNTYPNTNIYIVYAPKSPLLMHQSPPLMKSTLTTRTQKFLETMTNHNQSSSQTTSSSPQYHNIEERRVGDKEMHTRKPSTLYEIPPINSHMQFTLPNM